MPSALMGTWICHIFRITALIILCVKSYFGYSAMKLANVSPGSCFACKTSSGPDLAAKQTAFENLFLGQISSAQTTHLHSAVKTVNASSLTSAHDHTKAAGIAFAVIHAKKDLPVAFLQAALLGSGPVYQA